MKDQKCETCEYRGYSSDICKLHLRHEMRKGEEGCQNHSSHHGSIKKMGFIVALGAGVGLAATGLGVIVAPVAGLTAAIGQGLAVKLAAGGGAASAAAYMVREKKKNRKFTQRGPETEKE